MLFASKKVFITTWWAYWSTYQLSLASNQPAKIFRMAAGQELYDQLNINLVSMITLNTAFLDVFRSVKKRTILNMTAKSATIPRPSFGMTSMAKASRQLLLSILAKEEPDVRVSDLLH